MQTTSDNQLNKPNTKLKILMSRTCNRIRPEQFSVTIQEHKARNVIFIITMLLEWAIQMKKDLYPCFIDYTEVYRKVRKRVIGNNK